MRTLGTVFYLPFLDQKGCGLLPKIYSILLSIHIALTYSHNYFDPIGSASNFASDPIVQGPCS